MFWTIAIGFAVIYAVQTVTALFQAKNFMANFIRLRRLGPVAIGKKKGLFTAGAIVLFLLDDEGNIREGARLNGVTVLARFREFHAYDDQSIININPLTDKRFTKSLRQAVANARENYAVVHAGGVPTEPAAPLTQIGHRIKGLFHRNVAAA